MKSPPLRSLSTAALATAALSCTVLSCTIMPLGSDAGTGAGATSTQTVGDQCAAILEAFCARAIDGCGVPDTLSDCIANEMPACCTGSTCNAISESSSSALDACTAALASEDCNSVVNFGPLGVAECQGIPQAP